jgi:hypothetical protein
MTHSGTGSSGEMEDAVNIVFEEMLARGFHIAEVKNMD